VLAHQKTSGVTRYELVIALATGKWDVSRYLAHDGSALACL